jgi:hypothetical protein
VGFPVDTRAETGSVPQGSDRSCQRPASRAPDDVEAWIWRNKEAMDDQKETYAAKVGARRDEKLKRGKRRRRVTVGLFPIRNTKAGISHEG